MEITREQAETIAKDFLAKKNPTNWNGKGKKPKQFDTICCTYDLGFPYVALDIFFEYDKEEREWLHVCEMVDKDPDAETGMVGMCERLSGYGTDSCLNVADTILDICNTYDWGCDAD